MFQDSSHWYLPDGTPFYSVLSKGGTERSVTLADARKCGAVPSVTTVLGVLAKPALTNWMVDQGILAALTLPRIEGETEQAFITRVKQDSGAQAKAAAEEGTRIHDAIECAFEHRSIPHKYIPHVEATRMKIAELFPGVNDWIAEKYFAHDYGFGGKVDLHSPSTGIVIDYKGKDGDFSDGKKLAYDQHYQLAGYQLGLRLPQNVCCNIFVSRTHPGKVCEHIWKREEVEHGRAAFLTLLAAWKCIKKYDASLLAEAA